VFVCPTHINAAIVDVYARRIYIFGMDDARTENVVGALALALSDALLRDAQDQAPEPGPAAAAIALLGHEPGMAIERLRRALGLSHPGAVRLVDRLVADGLVVRRPSPNDRRAVALYLTDAGRERCRAIQGARQRSLARALAALAPAEREALGLLAGKLLGALVENLDQAYSVCRLCDPGVCSECPVDAALQLEA
jgi:DNA-binding MarR family transcriptional regulator